MTMPCQGSRTFGDGVHVSWECRDDSTGPACRVEVHWHDGKVIDAVLDSSRPEVPFLMTGHDTPAQRVRGSFVLDKAPPALRLAHLVYPGGSEQQVELCSMQPPRPDADPAASAASPAIEPAGDLFPYVHLQDWPHASVAARRDRFITYARDCDDDASTHSLYCTLKELARAGDREGMEREAVAFVEGEPRYAGAFIPDTGALPGILAWLGDCDRYLRQRPDTDLPTLVAELERMLGMSWPGLVDAVTDETFGDGYERVWQNVLALNVLPGYRRRLLDALLETLAMAHLLQRLIADTPEPGSDGATPLPPREAWPAQRIHDGVSATAILPHPVFPLPPPENHNAGDRGTCPPLLPYAIGELRLVRQRLQRYEPGEVCHVESVMQGERRETRSRALDRAVASATRADTADQTWDETRGMTEDVLAECAASVLSEVFRIHYSTTYGPPQTGRESGHREQKLVDDLPTRGEAEASLDLGRRITAQAAQRTATRIARERSSLTSREREEQVTRTLDATDSATDLQGVYRWLNAIHELRVVSYGRRLVLEAYLERPAEAFIAGRYSLHGEALVEPPPPSALGVTCFTDIDTDDPESPRYYAHLAGHYRMEAVEPPPEAHRTVSTTIGTRTGRHDRRLPLPDGYAAAMAWARLTGGDPAMRVDGVAGGWQFRLTTEAPEASGTLNGETGEVAAAVVPRADGSAGPAVVTVEVTAQPTRTLLDGWKSTFFAHLQAAYGQQTDAYRKHTGQTGSGPWVNPLASREAIRASLRRGVLRQLLGRARATGPYRQQGRFEPRRMHALEQAVEWSEMSFTLLADTFDPAGDPAMLPFRGDTSPLPAFLQARFARVLLPVVPGAEQQIGGFDIAVGHPGAVHPIQPSGNLTEPLQRGRYRHCSMLRYGAAVHPLHDDSRIVTPEDLVDRDHVGMDRAGGKARLRERIASGAPARQLDGHRPLQHWIPGPADNSAVTEYAVAIEHESIKVERVAPARATRHRLPP